jgi:DNA polymerase-3 subunit alpha
MLENLILAGAFDCFGKTRTQYLAVYSEFLDRVVEQEKHKNSAQLSLFDTVLKDDKALKIEYPDIPEFSSKEKLTLEKTVLGIYLSGHPLTDYKEQFDKFSFNTNVLSFFEEDENGEKVYTEFKENDHVVMGGIISEFKRLATRGGQNMAFVKVEDLYGQIEVICFPKVYESARDCLKEENTVRISGKLQVKDGVPQIIADDVQQLEVKEEKKTSVGQEYLGIIIPNDKADKVDDIIDVLTSYEGTIPVIIALKGKKYSANCAVRRCEGLISELKNYVREEDIIFFIKK